MELPWFYEPKSIGTIEGSVIDDLCIISARFNSRFLHTLNEDNEHFILLIVQSDDCLSGSRLKSFVKESAVDCSMQSNRFLFRKKLRNCQRMSVPCGKIPYLLA